MSHTSRHVSVWVNADWARVYDIASDRSRLAEWAAGLADPELGLEVAEFAPPNPYGVLDHVVRMPNGAEVFNPMRVIRADTPGACEIVFTLRRREDQTAEQFGADAAAVTEDLTALKTLAER